MNVWPNSPGAAGAPFIVPRPSLANRAPSLTTGRCPVLSIRSFFTRTYFAVEALHVDPVSTQRWIRKTTSVVDRRKIEGQSAARAFTFYFPIHSKQQNLAETICDPSGRANQRSSLLLHFTNSGRSGCYRKCLAWPQNTTSRNCSHSWKDFPQFIGRRDGSQSATLHLKTATGASSFLSTPAIPWLGGTFRNLGTSSITFLLNSDCRQSSCPFRLHSI